jgi:hypothetical protein
MLHRWLPNPDNSIDYNYLDIDTHNGPFCDVCRKFFCMICDDLSLLKCEEDPDPSIEWSPIGGELAMAIINRKGHNE